MNITVTFETIAEVKAFAEMITGPAVKEGKSSQNTAVTPVAQERISTKAVRYTLSAQVQRNYTTT